MSRIDRYKRAIRRAVRLGTLSELTPARCPEEGCCGCRGTGRQRTRTCTVCQGTGSHAYAQDCDWRQALSEVMLSLALP